MDLFVMIGLPGSGKSTLAKEIAEEKNALIISTDAIRKGYSITNPFPVAREMFITYMQTGRDVVYDATNLTTKNRTAALEMAKKFGYEPTAVVMLTPLDKCYEQNRKREDVVPDDVIDKFLRRFEYPYEGEFDHIRPIQTGISIFEAEDIDQESIHHSHTLLEHLRMTGDAVKKITKDEHLIEAAYNHDIGKPITKAHIDSKGEETEHAHYYGHENAGAYLWFTSREWSGDAEETGRLINYHMRPYVWAKSEKAIKKDKERFTEKFITQLTILHMGDEEAH